MLVCQLPHWCAVDVLYPQCGFLFKGNGEGVLALLAQKAVNAASRTFLNCMNTVACRTGWISFFWS